MLIESGARARKSLAKRGQSHRELIVDEPRRRHTSRPGRSTCVPQYSAQLSDKRRTAWRGIRLIRAAHTALSPRGTFGPSLPTIVSGCTCGPWECQRPTHVQIGKLGWFRRPVRPTPNFPLSLPSQSQTFSCLSLGERRPRVGGAKSRSVPYTVATRRYHITRNDCPTSNTSGTTRGVLFIIPGLHWWPPPTLKLSLPELRLGTT